LTPAAVQSVREREAALPAPLPSLQAPAAGPVLPLFDRVLAGMVAAGQGVQALCLLLGLTQGALGEHIVRLCLPTPHDRPLRKPGPRGWCIRDKIRLIFWRLLGVHPEIIGQRLEKPRSANAVRAQARRMGIPTPARRELHKPDPVSLREPDLAALFGFGRSDDCRHTVQGSPGDTRNRATSGVRDLLGPVPGAVERKSEGSSKAQGSNKAPGPATKRRAAGQVTPPGQRELSLLVVVGGTSKEPARNQELAKAPTKAEEPAKTQEAPKATAPSLPPIPTTEDEVDLGGDLSWFGRLTWKNPLKNRVAVWTFFMLIAGGLHYKAAAKRLGISPDAFRSIRTRMAVPVDRDRKKAGTDFDEEGARETLRRSGYVIKKCMQSDNFFWGHKDDRKTRFSPPFRKSEKIIGESSNLFEIVTRRVLDDEMRDRPAPFATFPASICA